MADFKLQQFNNHSQNFWISDNELLGTGTPLQATTVEVSLLKFKIMQS